MRPHLQAGDSCQFTPLLSRSLPPRGSRLPDRPARFLRRAPRSDRPRSSGASETSCGGSSQTSTVRGIGTNRKKSTRCSRRHAGSRITTVRITSRSCGLRRMRDPVAAALPVVSTGLERDARRLAAHRQHGHDPIAAWLDDHDLSSTTTNGGRGIGIDRHDSPGTGDPHRARDGRADRDRDLRARQRPHVHTVDPRRETDADAAALFVGQRNRASARAPITGGVDALRFAARGVVTPRVLPLKLPTLRVGACRVAAARRIGRSLAARLAGGAALAGRRRVAALRSAVARALRAVGAAAAVIAGLTALHLLARLVLARLVLAWPSERWFDWPVVDRCWSRPCRSNAWPARVPGHSCTLPEPRCSRLGSALRPRGAC